MEQVELWIGPSQSYVLQVWWSSPGSLEQVELTAACLMMMCQSNAWCYHPFTWKTQYTVGCLSAVQKYQIYSPATKQWNNHHLLFCMDMNRANSESQSWMSVPNPGFSHGKVNALWCSNWYTSTCSVLRSVWNSKQTCGDLSASLRLVIQYI